MRRKLTVRGGRVAGLLGLLALALSGCSAAQWENHVRFGWPKGVTEQGHKMQVLWTWTGVTALALGVVVWALIFWACIRYRKKNEDIPRQTKYNAAVELVCFVFPFIVIAGLFYRTVVVEDNVNKLSANPDVVVQVNAFKWGWQFEYRAYRGTDGQRDINDPASVFSYTSSNGSQLMNSGDKEKATPSGMKTLSTETAQPYFPRTTGSQFEIPVLVIPEGQTVQFIEHSEDVLHSFWVPEFLFKRDVVPYGTTDITQDNRFEITADKTGAYVGRCAELCGVYHSQMNFEVRIVTPAQFQKYVATLEQLGPNNPDPQPIALKAIGGDDAKLDSPVATTTYPFITDPTIRHASQNEGN